MKKILFIILTAVLFLGISLVADNRESVAGAQPRTAIIITPSPVYNGDAKQAVVDDVTYAYRSDERDEKNIQITAVFAPAEIKKLVLPDAIDGRTVTSLNL